ncbi:MAG TPA: MFS transporter, partial [Anaerovoracaceae bacterium]|nr:MFS transporter [Anaerovoracaceae bacterium]
MNEKPNIKSYRWFVWGLLIIIYLIGFFHRLSIGVIAEDLEDSFGMNAFQIANLGAMYFYAYTIMQIPTGILVDRLGARLVAVSGTVLAGIASILFSFASSITMAYAGRLLVGIGVSVVFLSALKVVTNWFPAKDFATMSGLTSFMGNMGGIFAQAPLILVAGFIGWRGSFLAMGIVTLMLAALAAVFVKNSPVDMGLPEVNPQPPQIREESGNIFYQLLEVVKNPRVWWPAIALGGVNGGFFLFSGTFGVSYITYAYGLDKIEASNIVSIMLLITAIAFVFGGKLSDTLKRRKAPLIILSALSLFAWTILIFIDPPVWYIYIFVTMLGLSSSIGAPCWSMGKEVSNPRYPAMAMSIVNGTNFLAAAVLPVICGRIIDIHTAAGAAPDAAYRSGFTVCVAGSLLALLFSILSKETKCENIHNK